ncbi:MAG: formylglycine-generating enzyme family protein [Limisphaerales bacterium]
MKTPRENITGFLLVVLLAGAVSTVAAPPGMVLIPAGAYRPFFHATTEPEAVPVKSFYLDTVPVTVGDFLAFVRARPQWQRSKVKAVFADEFYLKNWAADCDPGLKAPLEAPVTWVSWFAAREYAKWRGKRLPTVAEWERAAGASARRPDGENDPAFKQQVLQWYSTPTSPLAHVGQGPANYWGARDLHGLVWEWTLDFNSAISGDAQPGGGSSVRGLFCAAGAQGARDVEDYPAFMRWGFRSSLQANYCVHNLGFRCAKDL